MEKNKAVEDILDYIKKRAKQHGEWRDVEANLVAENKGREDKFMGWYEYHSKVAFMLAGLVDEIRGNVLDNKEIGD